MDFYTKMFLINLIVLFSVAEIDKMAFDDALEEIPIVRGFLGLWALVSFLSLPVWLIYFVVSF